MDTSSRGLCKRLLGGFRRSVGTRAVADGHPGRAGILHYGAHIGEVQVNQAGDGDDLGDGLNAVAQNFIGQAESAVNAGLLIADVEQAVVRDEHQGIDIWHQFGNAFFGYLHAVRAFKAERLGDDGDGERSGFLGHLQLRPERNRCRCRRPYRR